MPPPLPVQPGPAARPTCGQAIASLVLGIAAFVLCLGPLTGIPAIICGHIAKSKIQKSNATLGGDGLALAGLIVTTSHTATRTASVSAHDYTVNPVGRRAECRIVPATHRMRSNED